MAKKRVKIGETKLQSFTAPKDWWEAAERLAKSRQLTLSALIRQLIYEALPESERSKLTTPNPRGQFSEENRAKINSGEITPPEKMLNQGDDE